MNIATHYSPKISDHLLLSGLVLDTLENGQLDMHAKDYLEISARVREELALLDTPSLRQMCRKAPWSFEEIFENLLHERGEEAWALDVWAQLSAEVEWQSCCAARCGSDRGHIGRSPTGRCDT